MKQQKLALTGRGIEDKRRPQDFYPTPPDVVIALLNFLQIQPKSKTVWEPCCGDGSISKVLIDYGFGSVTSSDINSTYGDQIDFFDCNPSVQFDFIITNPPFNLAEKFIEKALPHAHVVAMLLKSQFWHAKKRRELFLETKPTHVLPLTWRPDFLNGERGGSPTMECLWTVWVKGNEYPCIYKPLDRPAKTQ